VTYQVDQTRGLNAEFNIFFLKFSGGLSVKMTNKKDFGADKDTPQLVQMNTKRIIKERLNKKTGQRWHEEKYVADPSQSNLFKQSNLSTSPIFAFDKTELVRIPRTGHDSIQQYQ
jgi:hypothetical protein